MRAGTREQVSAGSEPQHGVWPCATVGCDAMARDGGSCPRCAEEIAALEAMARAKGRAAPRSRRVEGLLYALAAVAVEMWFVWEFRGFFVDCLRLWLGR